MVRTAAFILALLAALPLAVSPALARPDARLMTCANLNALIQREGAVVVTTGEHTYDRFVAAPWYCDSRSYMAPAYQLTADKRRCVVHFTCADRAWDFDDMFD